MLLASLQNEKNENLTLLNNYKRTEQITTLMCNGIRALSSTKTTPFYFMKKTQLKFKQNSTGNLQHFMLISYRELHNTLTNADKPT